MQRVHVCALASVQVGKRGDVCVKRGEEGRMGGMKGAATAQSEDGGGGSESLIGCELRENMKPGSLMNLRG